MDRCCISELQLLGLFIRIIRKSSLFILHGHQLSIRIDLPDNAQVAVEHTHAALSDHSIDSPDLPLQLIVVFDLHDLVAFPEHAAAVFFFFFLRRRRIQVSLKDHIEALHPQRPLPHRCEDLDILGFRVHIPGKFL